MKSLVFLSVLFSSFAFAHIGQWCNQVLNDGATAVDRQTHNHVFVPGQKGKTYEKVERQTKSGSKYADVYEVNSVTKERTKPVAKQQNRNVYSCSSSANSYSGSSSYDSYTERQ